MGWKTIKGRRYYYRNERIGKNVLRQYIGGGRIAKLAAQLDESQRQAATAVRDAWQQAKANEDATDRQVDDLGEQVRTYIDAIMLATGHYRHRRQWRRKRGK